MSAEQKFKQSFLLLKEALNRLHEAVDEPEDKKRLNVDATIQRFEFCIELFWKTLKKLLEVQKQKTAFPKDTLKAAYAGGLIDNEELWLEMLDDRNNSSHLYDEDLADEVYEKIKLYYPEMIKTLVLLEEKYKSLLS